MTSSTPEPTPPLTDDELAVISRRVDTRNGSDHYLHTVDGIEYDAHWAHDTRRLLAEVDRLRHENEYHQRYRYTAEQNAHDTALENRKLRAELAGYERANGELKREKNAAAAALFDAGVESVPLAEGVKELTAARDKRTAEVDRLRGHLDEMAAYGVDQNKRVAQGVDALATRIEEFARLQDRIPDTENGDWGLAWDSGYNAALTEVRAMALGQSSRESATTPPEGGTDE